MKQQDVVVGEVYAVKVNGSIQPVRLETVSPHGGQAALRPETSKLIDHSPDTG